ncbi:MAG: radical SAM protein [Deltaproteobacteria bacterium]|nr:radical SAM protein [Deltaproteobacteria bacterium]
MKILIDPRGERNVTYPNVGLAYVSASLKEEHRVIDQYLVPFPEDRYLGYKTDWLGISVKMTTCKEAMRISRVYRQRYPGVKVIWGGAHVSCAYDKMSKENPEIELFKGEWDYTDDLDCLPFPDYSKFDSFEYLRSAWHKGTLPYPLITSRGCPYDCLYCATCLTAGKKWRARSVENCYQELLMATQKFHIRSFDILDDTFNLDKQRVISFCRVIKNLGLRWSCGNGLRADRFDEDIARAMAAAGCQHVSFGVESVAPEVLAAIKKGVDIEQIEKAVETARKYFAVAGFFIIGLPCSDYEKDLSSLKWAMQRQIGAHFQYLVPFEGTQLLKDYYPGENFDDALTFGLGAYPVSKEYSKALQERIYTMTRCMRPESSHMNAVKRNISMGKLIWMFDRKGLVTRPVHRLIRCVRRAITTGGDN